jgi:hypothetical protein
MFGGEMTAPLTDREPVALGVGSLAVLIDLGIAMATSLDWIDLTTEQSAAIIAFVTALSVVVGVILRNHVWSPASVTEIPTGPAPA